MPHRECHFPLLDAGCLTSIALIQGTIVLLLRHSLVVLLAIYPLVSSPIARGAEIVLDEFVDQAVTNSPSMVGEDVTTENVGYMRQEIPN